MTHTAQIQVFIVDDHPLVIDGLKNMLSSSEKIRVIGSAMNGRDTLVMLSVCNPDIVFLDINLPDISGIEICRKITELYPAIKCIALSTFNENSYITRMMEQGAKGYLLKNSGKEEILEAIEKVQKGEIYLQINHIPDSEQKPGIFVTRREKEVLELIAEGKTNQEIADQLFISVTTVNTHRKNLLFKFNVNNTAALIKQTVKAKII